MTFKETIAQDIKSVFLNFEEFGEIHNIEGKRKLVIIDENELTEREKKTKSTGADSIKGELHIKQLLFYIAASDFGALPSPGNILTFDQVQYVITDAGNEDGIYAISLEAISHDYASRALPANARSITKKTGRNGER